MSDEEFYSFSGIGAIVCRVDGREVTSTAFLVGAFDLGVTVAHSFWNDDRWIEPQQCVYTTTDSLGQIRERIPLEYIKTQWTAQPDSFGQVAHDFAVVKLQEPSSFAQRTMPLGRFSGSLSSRVALIGFDHDIAADTFKRRSRGTVYARASVAAVEGAFLHDMDARGLAAGAPVVDERSGVIVGLHTLQAGGARNVMIPMNDWLETTLRAEIALIAGASPP